MPEGLLVPNASTPPCVIPPWNIHEHDNVEALFELSSAYLNNGGCMLLFLPEVKNVWDGVRAFANTYDFTIVKNWWGINELLLCLRVDSTKIYFCVFIVQ